MEEKNSEKKERKMRDSGIPWIGEVPEGWGVNKIKYHLTRNEIKNKPDKQVLSVYRDYGVIPKDSRDDNHNVTSEDTSKYKYVQKGDLVINKMKAWQGSLGVSKYEGIVSPAYYIYKFHDDSFDGKFFHYLIRGCYKDEFRRISGGIREGQWDLSAEKFENTMIIIPPIPKQHRIADFLDSKCSGVDNLIENLRARVESAKEYKKAVITEAVTKGLDKDAKMKDSGVEWIGEIPEGWSFPKITHILDYTHPYPIGDGDHGSIKATDYTEYGIPFIRVQNLGFATNLCLDNVVYISEAQNRTIQNSTLKPNDILFAKTGATIGKVGIVPESIKKANTTSHVGKITVSESIVPKYIFYVLSSNIGYRQFWDIAAQKSTRPELSIDEIKTIRVLLPKTKEEQQQIADYLDSKCSEIDALLQNYEDQIATLEEYKKSLIYEYVTGKKEVPAA